jgi:hypothetical protein
VMVDVPRLGVVSLFCTESVDKLICEVTAAGYRSVAAGILGTVRVPLLVPRAQRLLERASTRRGACEITPMKMVPAAYLMHVSHPPHRTALLRMMIAEHGLAIELGRRGDPKCPRELRLCRMCGNSIEDEVHVLWECEGDVRLAGAREEWLEVLRLEHPRLNPPRVVDSRGVWLTWFEKWVGAKEVVPRLAKMVYQILTVVESYETLFKRDPS